MRNEHKRIILTANGVMLLVMVAFNLIIEPSKKVGVATSIARIGSLVGQVETKKSGSMQWEQAIVGQLLEEGDQIRTSLFSESILYLQGKSSVVVSADTTFEIGQDILQRSSFGLGIGQITAEISTSSKKEYEFYSQKRDVSALSKQGAFRMTADGTGTLVLDTHKGKVRLQSKGKKVWVTSGKRSIVQADKPPSQVFPIPTSITLQVKWPAIKTAKLKTTVSGKTTTGAMVWVNGKQVRADHEGHFSLEAPLQEGSNRLVVNATDPSGSSVTRSSPEIVVDTKPPGLEVDAKDPWK